MTISKSQLACRSTKAYVSWSEDANCKSTHRALVSGVRHLASATPKLADVLALRALAQQTLAVV